MSTSSPVDRWVQELEETISDAVDHVPSQEARSGLLGAVYGLDFGGQIAERVGMYASSGEYEEALDEESYTVGDTAVERFYESCDEGWRGMTETVAFSAGMFGGMMGPAALSAATMNPVFLGGYMVGPAVDALTYAESSYTGSDDVSEY